MAGKKRAKDSFAGRLMVALSQAEEKQQVARTIQERSSVDSYAGRLTDELDLIRKRTESDSAQGDETRQCGSNHVDG